MPRPVYFNMLLPRHGQLCNTIKEKLVAAVIKIYTLASVNIYMFPLAQNKPHAVSLSAFVTYLFLKSKFFQMLMNFQQMRYLLYTMPYEQQHHSKNPQKVFLTWIRATGPT
jgi:hypothetical protein